MINCRHLCVEVIHHEPHHELVPHLPVHDVVHHEPHHNVHHEVAQDHLLLPHHDHPPLLHPPSLGTAAPLGACTPLCSVLDLIVFNPEFTTLVSLLRAAGLVELLSQPGPITLFAPTQELCGCIFLAITVGWLHQDLSGSHQQLKLDGFTITVQDAFVFNS